MSRELFMSFLERVSSGGDKKILTPLSYRFFAEYSDKGRHYHTIPHILMGIKEIDELRRDTDTEEFDRSAMNLLEFAWWYHDLVYDPKKQDNEENSAYEAGCDCDELLMHYSEKIRVSHFIRATKIGHVPQNIYEKYIQDIDLVIFGQPQDVVFQYDDDIRREYSFVEEDVFKKERGKILRKFLEGEIYKTKYFKKKYEGLASLNLSHLVSERYPDE